MSVRQSYPLEEKRDMPIFAKEETPGLIPDSFDPKDAWADEVLGESELLIPPTYTIEGLTYEPQGSYPFCVSFACTTLLEYLYGKEGKVFGLSQQHLFFNAGGSKTGSGFRANLDILKNKGAIPYSKLPMPPTDVGRGSGWYERLKPTALATPFEDVHTLAGYVRVMSTEESLKRSIMEYGPIIVGVNAGGDYYNGDAVRTKKEDNHCVLLVGWTPTQWKIFDSLFWVKKEGGYGTLSRAYTFNSAYIVTELPKNWKKKVEKARSEGFENALNHYGKQRNFEAEQRVATELLNEFKKFNNQSVLDAAGRFWTVLVNAAVYGGYSISYRKFGIWQPGDLINFVYHWRRTGQYLFDLNQVRQ